MNWLSGYLDDWTVGKVAILCTIGLVYLNYGSVSSDGTPRYVIWKGIAKQLDISRQISILAVAQILIRIVQGIDSSIAHPTFDNM